MSQRGEELVTADEPAVVAEPLLDATIVEDGESDRCLADSASTNKSKWSEVFCQFHKLLGQLAASKEVPWRGRW